MKPIGSFLSGQRLKLAELQDYVIDIIYDEFQPDALLYGGTAIWRCFDGTRFSEDIDIYMDSNPFNAFASKLEKYGLRLIWQDPEAQSRIRIGNDEAELLLETKPGYAENEIRTYARTDGTTKTISVFSPTELMVRKIEAYLNRRFVRDLYDLFILTKWLNRSDYLVKTMLFRFLKEIQRPVDENILDSLIYSGRKDLSFAQMVKYIERWLNEV
ncbi:MAG: nucleotidyl transferase AbiEii/AbiGii toxin family protein [Ferroplasma sp.]